MQYIKVSGLSAIESLQGKISNRSNISSATVNDEDQKSNSSCKICRIINDSQYDQKLHIVTNYPTTFQQVCRAISVVLCPQSVTNPRTHRQQHFFVPFHVPTGNKIPQNCVLQCMKKPSHAAVQRKWNLIKLTISLTFPFSRFKGTEAYIYI